MSDTQELVCERDGVPTRLRCARCEAGICPGCLVGTPVGYTCPVCAGRPAERRGRATRPLVGAGLAVLVALGAVAVLRPSADPAVEAVTPEPVPAKAAPPNRQAMLGEEVRDGQLAFRAEEFTCDGAQLPAVATARAAATPEGRICMLRLTVRNVSSGPALLLGRFQYLVDAQSRTYGADQGLSAEVPENANRSLTEMNVNPEVTVPLVLLYDLPRTVDPVEAQFRGTGRSRFGVNVRLDRRPG
jgi:hypothetical protein